MKNRNRWLAIIVLICCAICLIPDSQDGLTFARRGKKKKKKARTGVFEKGKYTDKTYGFSVDIVEGWKVKVSNEGKRLRFIAQKKNYATPRWLRGGELLTIIPTLKVYVDTTSMTGRQFADSLSSKSYQSEQKEAIRDEFRIYQKRVKKHHISNIRLNTGERGVRCKMIRKYNIETGRGPHPEYMQGDILFVKRGDNIFVISGVCLSLFYKGNNAPLFQEMFDSFAFAE